MRRLVVAFVVLAVLLGLGAYEVTRLTRLHIPFLTDTCRVYDGDHITRVDPEQLDHAATIAAVGARRDLPARAVTVALATALQESKLRNLNNGDRDSIGLFQQRPSQGWGTPAQLRDPRYAAGEFYAHLLKVPGWETMRVTDAAQAVQRSGHPEAYQKWADDARALAVAFLGATTGAVTCQLRERTAMTGNAASRQAVTELGKDLGKLSVVPRPSADGPTLAVAVGGGSSSTLGWRTAHWFVAKSHQYGVQRVAYDGRVWTAGSGRWAKDAKASPDRVDVRISPDA